MKTRVLLIVGIVVLFQCCQKNEQQVNLDRALDIKLSLESSKLNQREPNYLTIKMQNTSDNSVKLPDSNMIVEFTSYSGSIRRVIPLQEIVNGDSDVSSLSDLTLKPKEEKLIRIELGNVVFSKLQNTDNQLPADDYTINIFLAPEKDMKEVKYADNVRSNYVDVMIYD